MSSVSVTFPCFLELPEELQVQIWMGAADSDSNTQLGQEFLVLLNILERRRSIMFRLFLMMSTSPSLFLVWLDEYDPSAEELCERLRSLASGQMRLLRTCRMSREAVFSVWRKRVHAISTSPAPYMLEYFDWFDYPPTEERLKEYKGRIIEVLDHLLEATRLGKPYRLDALVHSRDTSAASSPNDI